MKLVKIHSCDLYLMQCLCKKRKKNLFIITATGKIKQPDCVIAGTDQHHHNNNVNYALMNISLFMFREILTIEM